MEITLTFAKLLLRLINGEQIPIGQFNSEVNKNLLNNFIADFALSSPKPKGKTKLIYCSNETDLRNYLFSKGVPHLENYIEYLETGNYSRAENAIFASDTKIKNFRVFEGFFVNTYLDLFSALNNQKISLKPVAGSWIYIVDYKNFKIEKDITIVGVENTENFKFIEKYKHLFADIKPLFLLRYDNNTYIDWLKSIPNDYLHFGDFDLSALIIYITEFKNKLPEKQCNFFVPKNLEEYFRQTNNYKDYDKQLNDERIKNFNFTQYPEIMAVVDLILKYKKIVSQEILIK
ncbi:MAG: hypothetical protein JXL97_11315 [Bacteroidales bacterium]|nr:hypothetical protein [Bacteroidales bacterium]